MITNGWVQCPPSVKAHRTCTSQRATASWRVRWPRMPGSVLPRLGQYESRSQGGPRPAPPALQQTARKGLIELDYALVFNASQWMTNALHD